MARGPTYSTQAELDSPLSALASAPFATQDLAAVKVALDGIDRSAGSVSKSLTSAFANATLSSKAFSSTLSGVAAMLSQVLSQSLGGALSSGFSSLLGGLFGGSSPVIAPFADGGIVASPTFFGAGGSMGLMGERGAEAILPLSRGPNGQLGIATQGSARPTTIHVTIATQDVESFRRSESQVAGALARAVARGQRAT